MSSEKGKLESIRTDYTKGELCIVDMLECPGAQLKAWVLESDKDGVKDSNSFSLSTVNSEGYPTGRIVLARDISSEGIVFYTNKKSDKASEIERLSRVGATFFWAKSERQVRVVGEVEHLDEDEAVRYFASRPRGSQIGAWVSQQSMTLLNREELTLELQKVTDRFKGVECIPKPPHWGGYVIRLHKVEFWQGRASRLHDRVLYTMNSQSWSKSLLQP